MIGIAQRFYLAADQTFTSTAVLATLTGFSFPIAAAQVAHVRARLVVSVGATGGIRAQLTTPATTFYGGSMLLANTVAPAVVTAAQQTTQTVFTNALANAGTHFLDLEYCLQPTVAGTIALQVAQNTSDVLTLTVHQGSWMEAVTF